MGKFGAKAFEVIKTTGADVLGSLKEQLSNKVDSTKDNIVDSINDVTSDIKVPTISTGLDNKTMMYGVVLIFGAILLFFGIKKKPIRTYKRARRMKRNYGSTYKRRK